LFKENISTKTIEKISEENLLEKDGIIISLLVGLKIYQDFFINYMIPLMNILSNSPF